MRFWYALAYVLCRLVFAIPYPMRYIGRENIPEGAVIVCANHSRSLDPFLVAFALKLRRYPKFMAKKELFETPALRWALTHIGVFPVDRGNMDLNATRTAIKYLKSGEIIMIFPEGTRVSPDESVAAKTGAIKLAEKHGVPILPIGLPLEAKPLRRGKVIIGKPYYIPPGKRTAADYQALSDELMQEIYNLRQEA